jgi:hypothetical protein
MFTNRSLEISGNPQKSGKCGLADKLPVLLFLAIFVRMQHFKRKSTMLGKLRDGIFPLTVHADESMNDISYFLLDPI